MTPVLACVIARDAQGEIVGFRAGAGEHRASGPPQFATEGIDQGFGVIQQGFLHVTRVGAEDFELLLDRFNDTRMRVTQRYHVVVGVEIFVAMLVIEEDALGARNLDRRLVEEPIGRAKQPLPPRHVRGVFTWEMRRILRVEAIRHVATEALGQGGRLLGHCGSSRVRRSDICAVDIELNHSR